MRFTHLLTHVVGRLRSIRGISTIDTAAALTAVSILAGAAAPVVDDYVSRARVIRATHDVNAIAVALVNMTSDVTAQGRKQGGWATFDVLAGEGQMPTTGSGGDQAWLGGNIGRLRDQLVLNGAGYDRRPMRVSEPRGWHGPYIQNAIPVDPWGYAYLVNIRALASGASNTVVVSAGPNGVIETPFEGQAIVPGGDDYVALVSTGN